MSQDAVTRHAEAVIRAGSKSFAAASLLFARETREQAWSLYAWCRYCDDVIDDQVLGHAGPASADAPYERLALLRALTLQALEGDAPLPPEFEAFRRVSREAAIPASQALALLDGFAMDVEGRRYERLEDVIVYAYHVAGVVGVMMAEVMGVRERSILERACDLGLALQLINIARDVIDDAEAGRVYLPADWLAEAGVAATPAAVKAPAHREAVAQVATRLLAEADRYAASASAGIARLPLRSAWAVAAARDVYGEIGRVVRRRGSRAWDQRARASDFSKLLLLLHAGLDAVWLRTVKPSPPREGLWTMP